MLLESSQIPILRQLIAQANRSQVALHVPGHHMGRDLPGLLSNWLGQATKLDLTELPGLDNLHDAQGCIQESQALAAAHYGSEACFYSVNGSTACIMGAMAACVAPGERVLMMNPFHLSAWRGLVLADAIPVLQPFEWLKDEWTFAAPSLEDLRRALAVDADFAAIYVTSPTYQGKIAPIREIVRLAHQYQIPVIVDEAHGAHLGLIAEFPEHSVQAGADIVIQSVHKTLPSLTQTAWVHVQGTQVSPESVRQQLNFLQSTSPSYLLLASLDAAQAWLRTEGPLAASRVYERLQQFEDLHRPLNRADLADPLRQWIPVGDAKTSQQLYAMLAEQGMYAEYADTTGVLSMFGYHLTEAEIGRYVGTVEAWRATYQGQPAEESSTLAQLLSCSGDKPFRCSPRTAHQLPKRRVHLSQSVGQISGALLTPYPPGVPVLRPGQEITREFIEAAIAWIASGHSLQGIDANGQLDIIVGSGGI